MTAVISSRTAGCVNCGLGTFLMPLCAIAMLWKGGELFAMPDAMFAQTAGSVDLPVAAKKGVARFSAL